MFHRIGAAAYKANLDNIIAISNLTGNPHNRFKTVHIAGTNGKGSVSNMLASVFMEAGYKAGLFTSPHLKDFRERIRVNGEMITENFVIDFVDTYSVIFDNIKPSFFEWTTALAFAFFAEQNTDVAIIETGLGGRLDSTNIITPELSIITNISYDHMNLLGDTLEKIASEKAGIIKKGVPVVIGERQHECDHVFSNKAAEMKSEIVFASDHFIAERGSVSLTDQSFTIHKDRSVYHNDLRIGLRGIYQQKNICTVAQSFEKLKGRFDKLDAEAFIKGVANVRLNTGLRGRWEILNNHPLTIADIGHNEAGIQMVVEQLNELLSERKEAKLHIVFGVVNDKDSDSILKLLPLNANYYFCRADMPRALDVDKLAVKAESFQLTGRKYNSVKEAYEGALKNASENDIVFIGGSTFVVAEVI